MMVTGGLAAEDAAALYLWTVEAVRHHPPRAENGRAVGRALAFLIETAGDEIHWEELDLDPGTDQR
jgi:fido (protein-threonine AMPylation protein)